MISPEKQKSYTILSNNENELSLTKRESECLFFLLRGKTAKETAILLDISSRTVEQHLDALKNKFSCTTKLQLIAKAVENNYLKIIPQSLLNL